MIASFPAVRAIPAIQTLHDKFLAILPRIERHGRIYFRHVRRSQRKQDLLSEMLCLTWKWFVRLAQRGKDASKFVSVLARFAAQAVLDGRRLCGTEKAHDVLSPRAQQRHGFSINPLPEGSHLIGNNLDEALRDNMQTPVPDQVSFRLDYPRWRSRRCRRDRRGMDELVQGE